MATAIATASATACSDTTASSSLSPESRTHSKEDFCFILENFEATFAGSSSLQTSIPSTIVTTTSTANPSTIVTTTSSANPTASPGSQADIDDRADLSDSEVPVLCLTSLMSTQRTQNKGKGKTHHKILSNTTALTSTSLSKPTMSAAAFLNSLHITDNSEHFNIIERRTLRGMLSLFNKENPLNPSEPVPASSITRCFKEWPMFVSALEQCNPKMICYKMLRPKSEVRFFEHNRSHTTMLAFESI